jgi:hypothetical protein
MWPNPRSKSKISERFGAIYNRAGAKRRANKLFFGREAAPSVSIGHIREFQDKLRRLLATLLEI